MCAQGELARPRLELAARPIPLIYRRAAEIRLEAERVGGTHVSAASKGIATGSKHRDGPTRPTQLKQPLRPQTAQWCRMLA